MPNHTISVLLSSYVIMVIVAVMVVIMVITAIMASVSNIQQVSEMLNYSLWEKGNTHPQLPIPPPQAPACLWLYNKDKRKFFFTYRTRVLIPLWKSIFIINAASVISKYSNSFLPVLFHQNMLFKPGYIGCTESTRFTEKYCGIQTVMGWEVICYIV